MDYELNVPAILRRAEQLFPRREIVTRLPGKSFHRYTYADFAGRARQLASAFRKLGLKEQGRRPRRNALLEPLPAPGGLLRGAALGQR
jgi:fatty-acyl-CoA synthase